MGVLLRVFVRPERLKDVVEVTSAQVKEGSGLEGDHCKGGKRQVTILSLEAWNKVCGELGQRLDPSLRRANLLIEGVCLGNSVGQTLIVGDVKILIAGETAPCRLMDDAYKGLKGSLTPDWRGGVFGEVVSGGEISVGDNVVFQED